MINKKKLRARFYKFLEDDTIKNEDIFAFWLNEIDNLSACNHIMVETGRYEKRCKFCGLTQLTAK
jgi:hypothetical protein